jgi:hypothetical protein
MAVGNLELIDKTEITSSVSSVDITDVFSDKYDVYKIVTNGIEDTTNTPSVHLRFINSSGSVVSASNYDYAYLNMASNTAFAELRATNESYIRGVFGFSSANDTQGSVAYIFNPYSSSSYTFSLYQMSSVNTTLRSIKGIGVLKQTTSMTGFQVFDIDSTDFSEGIIRTYGLASN